MEYKLVTGKYGAESNIVCRINDNTYIPFDPNNTDYQAFLAWKEQGNEPLPAEETV